MRIPQLKMESQSAMIAIRQTASQMNIQQPKADINMQLPQADLQISTIKGRLTIDQSKAFAEANLKSALRWNEDMAAEGKLAVNTGVARRARQGNQMIDIHLGGNAIVASAVENGHPPDKMVGIKYIPSPFSVQIDYEPGNVDFEVQKNNPQLHVQTKEPEIQTHRGGVSISLAQEAYLRMYVEQT